MTINQNVKLFLWIIIIFFYPLWPTIERVAVPELSDTDNTLRQSIYSQTRWYSNHAHLTQCTYMHITVHVIPGLKEQSVKKTVPSGLKGMSACSSILVCVSSSTISSKCASWHKNGGNSSTLHLHLALKLNLHSTDTVLFSMRAEGKCAGQTELLLTNQQ